MALHFILDGYNIIHQQEPLMDKSLKEARDSLIRMIEFFRPQGSLNNKVTVVFDGRSEIWGGTPSSSVKVIFSKDESADSIIQRLVSQATNRKNIVVVTDDREIQYGVRPQGAQIMAVSLFLKKMAPPLDSRRPLQGRYNRTREEDKHIPKGAEHQIKEELERIWLDRKREK